MCGDANRDVDDPDVEALSSDAERESQHKAGICFRLRVERWMRTRGNLPILCGIDLMASLKSGIAKELFCLAICRVC
jgi:hypothetical protein